MTLALPANRLIVSCQARADNPLHGPMFMGAIALAARDGGAGALRANGPDDVRAVTKAGLPVIGINKIFGDYPVYITPSFATAAAIAEAGAGIIALDCTLRPREGGEAPKTIVKRIREELGLEVFADISTLEEGIAAEDWGVSYVATTLSGYTEETKGRPNEPDLKLIEALAARLSVPVIGEGRFNTPEDVRRGFEAGAYSVVVGTMITNPREITRRFIREGVPA